MRTKCQKFYFVDIFFLKCVISLHRKYCWRTLLTHFEKRTLKKNFKVRWFGPKFNALWKIFSKCVIFSKCAATKPLPAYRPYASYRGRQFTAFHRQFLRLQSPYEVFWSGTKIINLVVRLPGTQKRAGDTINTTNATGILVYIYSQSERSFHTFWKLLRLHSAYDYNISLKSPSLVQEKKQRNENRSMIALRYSRQKDRWMDTCINRVTSTFGSD